MAPWSRETDEAASQQLLRELLREVLQATEMKVHEVFVCCMPPCRGSFCSGVVGVPCALEFGLERQGLGFVASGQQRPAADPDSVGTQAECCASTSVLIGGNCIASLMQYRIHEMLSKGLLPLFVDATSSTTD